MSDLYLAGHLRLNVTLSCIPHDPFERRHRSEQYLTCSQSLSHFFRQVKGFKQTEQILEGKFDFFILKGVVLTSRRIYSSGPFHIG